MQLKLLKTIIFTFCLSMILSSCITDKYNISGNDNIPDARKGDPYVYGEPDSPPRQLANEYEDTDEAKEASKEIFVKFFGRNANGTPLTPAEDSTATSEIPSDTTQTVEDVVTDSTATGA